MKIRYFATFREQTGEAELVWDSAAVTLGELLEELSARYGEAFGRLVWREGELSPGVTVLVNGRDSRQSGGLDAPLAPRDSIFLLPLAGGG